MSSVTLGYRHVAVLVFSCGIIQGVPTRGFNVCDCVAALRRRERAIELLGELYMGQIPLCDVDDDDHGIRAHILRRLRRLCTIPDSARLADVAKQTLKEAFTFRMEPPTWQRIVCGSKASTGASIAGMRFPTSRRACLTFLQDAVH